MKTSLGEQAQVSYDADQLLYPTAWKSGDTQMARPSPRLDRFEQADGIVIHTDEGLYQRSRIRVAFSERTGGVSLEPWKSLNLATHVGDEESHVTANRVGILSAIGVEIQAVILVTAEQVHGDSIATVDQDALRSADAPGANPFVVPATDALLTQNPDVALLMLYADCVPIILVAESPTPCVCVVHAGWRGVLSSLPEQAATELIKRAGCSPQEVSVYIGAHIGSCCFRVAEELLLAFVNKFGESVAAGSAVDLRVAVEIDLLRAGVSPECITSLQTCTAHNTGRFFSYRADGVTGRHGALALIG